MNTDSLQGFRQDLNVVLTLEVAQKKERKEFFSTLTKEQQVNLMISATDCYARSSNHGSIEETLNEMLDLILALRD